jgi:nitroreductase
VTPERSQPQDPMRGLGANERALIERVRWKSGRHLAARVVRAKMRLQFTGWLQYLLPIPIIALLAMLAGLSWLAGARWLVWAFLGPAGVLTLVAAFDIVTTKLRIRFPESRPPRLDDLDRFELLLRRRSCRSFQTRRMTEADREALLNVVRTQLAIPTIGRITPRLEYVAAPLTVWPTVNASEFLVAIVPAAYDRTPIIDVGRTLQRVVMEATRMGLATCWIGPGADQRSIAAHLGDRFDPRADHIVCVCAVGYRSRYIPLFIRLFNHQMSPRRLPRSELFFADETLEQAIDTTAPPLLRFDRAWEACRWAPSSYNGQTTRAIVETDADGCIDALHFLTVTDSRYYAPVALGIWCANWELACEALGERGVFMSAVGLVDGHRPVDVTWRPIRDAGARPENRARPAYRSVSIRTDG